MTFLIGHVANSSEDILMGFTEAISDDGQISVHAELWKRSPKSCVYDNVWRS